MSGRTTRSAWARLVVIVAAVSAVVVGVAARLRRHEAAAGSPPTDVPTAGGERGAVPLPDGLPPLVLRYLRRTEGAATIPRIEDAWVWGRWRMRLGPVWATGRYDVRYVFGHSMRRRMTLGVAGLPIVRGLDEADLDAGTARTTMMGRTLDSGPNVVSAAAVVLWLDSFLFRSAAVLDPRVRWEQAGQGTVRLTYPLPGGGKDSADLVFDPPTGRLLHAIAQRHKSSKKMEKTGWRADVLEWRTLGGMDVPAHFRVTWEDQGVPWSEWRTDGVVFNVSSKRQSAGEE